MSLPISNPPWLPRVASKTGTGALSCSSSSSQRSMAAAQLRCGDLKSRPPGVLMRRDWCVYPIGRGTISFPSPEEKQTGAAQIMDPPPVFASVRLSDIPAVVSLSVSASVGSTMQPSIAGRP